MIREENKKRREKYEKFREKATPHLFQSYPWYMFSIVFVFISALCMLSLAAAMIITAKYGNDGAWLGISGYPPMLFGKAYNVETGLMIPMRFLAKMQNTWWGFGLLGIVMMVVRRQHYKGMLKTGRGGGK